MKTYSNTFSDIPEVNIKFALGILVSAMLILAIVVPNAQAQAIYTTDFNKEEHYWKDYAPKAQWDSLSSTVSNQKLSAKARRGKFGTVDIANTTIPSDGLKLTVKELGSEKEWNASLNSGLLPVKNDESNLGKLTISFDHALSSIRPVLVRIESFDKEKRKTGALEKHVYPATSDFYLRSTMELSEMEASGIGKFNPQDPFVQFSFEISNLERAGYSEDSVALRIDNFAFSKPAFYVSPTGNNSNDGRIEKTAFADPQAALDLAKAGDIILLMEGNYKNPDPKNPLQPAVARFKRPGGPASYITLKNYPGHKPVILCHGSDGVMISQGSKFDFMETPLFSYLEIRGLTIRGNSEEVFTLYPNEIGDPTKNTETRGINIDATYAPTRMYHHIRIADNLVEYCGADGIFASAVDYLTLENNIIRFNNFTTVSFAMAGFSLMMYADFDKVDNVTKILVRGNEAYGNQCKVYKKTGPHKIFNGNGMLFDANSEEYLFPDAYLGRTLIQNNLVYGNGGGGIQNWGSHRLDIVNNTLYHNGITPELKWGNLGFDFCKDVNVVNNIVVALEDRPLDSWMEKREDRNTANIVRVNNLYFGGVKPNIKGQGDIVGDPLFVNPTLDHTIADFSLKENSPAIGAGIFQKEYVPIIDINEKWRKLKSNAVTLGSLEK
ncbi:right-handed parallel beta-helix repeat-containing protein [Algoriphagus antarcticus]|uniref:Parallel beta helix pectate lyase-like protein n=1 Tax=Algoriphagus antarcticus TaxID=238540 RepID=A0A3E0D4C4_9BACT|nr:right-handed parallel beta-helix repeat-containing protein [Algoriphagus antarcticus]REG77536.1 parallel beta helix pectate lyase-like protein [Algoriphagus antarcticus]